MPEPAEPIFFATPARFHAWLERHHADRTEVIVGFHRKASGKPSMTWSEAVDEALCFGWIDGVRRTIDAISYSNRFTPRTARSTWSAVNVAKVETLIAEGRMTPAGLAAFERRDPARTAIYAHEQRTAAKLEPAMERRFRAGSRRVGVVPGSGAVVPTPGDLVGDQREETRDPGAPPRPTDRGCRGRTPRRSAPTTGREVATGLS